MTFTGASQEPSPGEPAISTLTSAMEMLQLLPDAGERGQQAGRREREGGHREFVKVEAFLSCYIHPSQSGE